MQSLSGRAEPGVEPVVFLVGSSGGHLQQLYRLKGWWEAYPRLWVTTRKPDAESLLRNEETVWCHHPTTRNVPNMLRNFQLAWRLIRERRPALIVSTGAGVAFPFFLAARLHRVSTAYLEVYDRIDSPTLTGRLCHPLSNVFALQWESQRPFYPRGEVIGRVL
jgi:UDP-N-acetylglucosamine:LPS N-acetylglucosamine transferase